MKYPYIGINKAGTRVLFFSRANQFVISPGDGSSLLAGHNYNSIIPEFYENITHESLQNTYGEVASPEHAEFIIELAVGTSHFTSSCYRDGVDNYFYITRSHIGFSPSAETAGNRGEKQITIPLPPKTEPLKNAGDNLVLGCEDSKCDEWPQVGDEVQTSVGNGAIALGADKNGMYIVMINGCYRAMAIDALKKPKTPEEEELYNDIEHVIHQFEGDKVAGRKWLMSKYNITKKPQ